MDAGRNQNGNGNSAGDHNHHMKTKMANITPNKAATPKKLQSKPVE